MTSAPPQISADRTHMDTLHGNLISSHVSFADNSPEVYPLNNYTSRGNNELLNTQPSPSLTLSAQLHVSELLHNTTTSIKDGSFSKLPVQGPAHSSRSSISITKNIPIFSTDGTRERQSLILNIHLDESDHSLPSPVMAGSCFNGYESIPSDTPVLPTATTGGGFSAIDSALCDVSSDGSRSPTAVPDNYKHGRRRDGNNIHLSGSGTGLSSQRIVQKKISVKCPQNIFKCSIHVRPTLNPDVGKYAIIMSPYLRDADLLHTSSRRPLTFTRPMNFLIWNCRGSTSPEFKNHFKDLLELHKTTLVIILETHRMNHQTMPCEFHFSNIVAVPASGQAGGIAILWQADLLNIMDVAMTHQEIHCKIQLTTPITTSHKPFRMETIWTTHPQFPTVIRNSWIRMNNDFLPSISCFQTQVAIWNKEVFKNIFYKKRRILDRLGGIQKSPHYPTSIFLQHLESSLTQELNKLLHVEQEFWKVKSCIHWLNERDANTKFNHMSTIHRRCKNRIFALRDSVRNWLDDRQKVRDLITSFFSDLYSTNRIHSNRQVHQAYNHFITKELLCHLQNSKCRKGYMLAKIDLEKAFDRLEWSFIHGTLLYFRSPQNLVTLIMSCISTTSVSLLINGSATPFFRPSRGIRQGDPLSLYLFIMCMERISRRIDSAVENGLWTPIKLTARAPPISRLLFADDIILCATIDSISCNSMTQHLLPGEFFIQTHPGLKYSDPSTLGSGQLHNLENTYDRSVEPFWVGLGISVQINKIMLGTTDHDPQRWLRRILEINLINSDQPLSLSTIPSKVFLLWSIWIGRNNCIFEKRPFNINLARVLPVASEFWYLTGKSNPKKHSFPLYVKWKPPATNNIMLNSDATFRHDTSCAVIAGIFRNHNGDWLLGFIDHIFTTSPLEAETHALMLGLSIALQYRFHPLEINIDCEHLVRLLQVSSNVNASVLIDCKYLLRALNELQIVHVSSEQNKLTDALARVNLYTTTTTTNRPLLLWHPLTSLEDILQADRRGGPNTTRRNRISAGVLYNSLYNSNLTTNASACTVALP
ncbi:hypothetical protein FXO37_02220 [Capsicum annuum]|nr:hypothetical protein FXO37_02220 [Capsicum annuum]